MKLQRYQAYISSCCESGCGESMDDNGDYVMLKDVIQYLDYIHDELMDYSETADECREVIVGESIKIKNELDKRT